MPILYVSCLGKSSQGKKKKRTGDEVGDDLLSQGATPQVPSARVGLTTGFEKGPGVPPPPWTPTHKPVLCLDEERRRNEHECICCD
jgi:hypothetical protein